MVYRMVYIQMNLFAIILLGIMLYGLQRRHGNRFLTDQRVFEWLLLSNLVILLLDSATWLLEGWVFPGSFLLASAASFGFYAMNPVMALVYLVYCQVKLGMERETLRRQFPFYCIPFFLHLALAVWSLFRPVLFSLGPDNRYQRGPLFPLSMVLSYAPILYAVIQILRSRRCSPKYSGRSRLCRSLLLFPVPPLVGGILQLASSEVSVVWASAVISTLIIFINLQNAAITTDALTGLFNRGQIAPYLNGKIHKRGGRGLYVILMDLDGFKQINDQFGHTVGDRALQAAAEVLWQGLGQSDFLARYGGDEFLLVAERETASDIPVLIAQIRNSMAHCSQRSGEPYKLSVSAGHACWQEGYESIDALIAEADRRMYEDKSARKRGQTVKEVTPSPQ